MATAKSQPDPCLWPDKNDSACPCCQRRFHREAASQNHFDAQMKLIEGLIKGLEDIRDSTYRNSTTLRAIAADLIEQYK